MIRSWAAALAPARPAHDHVDAGDAGRLPVRRRRIDARRPDRGAPALGAWVDEVVAAEAPAGRSLAALALAAVPDQHPVHGHFPDAGDGLAEVVPELAAEPGRQFGDARFAAAGAPGRCAPARGGGAAGLPVRGDGRPGV